MRIPTKYKTSATDASHLRCFYIDKFTINQQVKQINLVSQYLSFFFKIILDDIKANIIQLMVKKLFTTYFSYIIA